MKKVCDLNGCVFKKEFNRPSLDLLGAGAITSIANGGNNVEISYGFDLLERLEPDELLNKIQNANPQLKINYSATTDYDLETKKETKPIWNLVAKKNRLILERV